MTPQPPPYDSREVHDEALLTQEKMLLAYIIQAAIMVPFKKVIGKKLQCPSFLMEDMNVQLGPVKKFCS